ADHADHAGVDELLRGSRALFRIRRVVLGQQLEADLLAADRDLLGVEFLDGELATEFVVLAEVRDAAGERRDVADLDDGLGSDRSAGGREGRSDCETQKPVLHQGISWKMNVECPPAASGPSGHNGADASPNRWPGQSRATPDRRRGARDASSVAGARARHTGC